MDEVIDVKKQLKISIPIAFENLINLLMTLVDTLVISLVGTKELTALGAMSVIINIMQMGIQTINVSNNTLVAKYLGEKDEEKIKTVTGNSIILTFIIAILIILVMLIIHPIFPILFQVDKIANIYLVIMLFGFIQNSLVTILSGHQRTIGNQKGILKLRIFAIILNLILDIIVVKSGYGIVGVALITVFIDSILASYLFIISKNTIKILFVKSYFKEILQLCKWNFIERIASKIDNFIFNLIVARMGTIYYAVQVILMQIVNIYESFIQGFGDGITISIGIASGKNDKKYMTEVKRVAKKIVNYSSFILPIIIFIISLIIMNISLQDENLQYIFYKILPLLLLGTYTIMSATYFFAILRGNRDFKFLAKRNIISSIIKILVAIILSCSPLGLIGVWIGYLIYGITQKYLSKKRCRYLSFI